MNYRYYKIQNALDEKAIPFDINNLTEAGIKEIYIGRDKGCRCGCGGKYYTPENKMWKRMTNQFKKLVEVGCVREVEKGDFWINVAFGNEYYNKCYCFYTKEQFSK